jgi:hypothetical protein
MSKVGTAERMRPPVAVALCVALCVAGCAPGPQHFMREGATEDQFKRSSQSCRENASTRAAQEVDDSLLRQGGRSTGPPLDASTNPNTKNDQRRRERRIRYFYRECMEARGWIANDEGTGFQGI